MLFMTFSTAKAAEDVDDGHIFTMLNASNGLADNSAQTVTCTKTGRMVISTLGNINFYDGSGFTHVDARQQDSYQLANYSGNYRLEFDRRHHLWVKNTFSVTCMDLTQEKFIQNVDSVFKTLGCDDQVDDLFIDSLGNIWLLTEEGLYGVEQQQTFPVEMDKNLQDVEIFDNLLLLFYGNGEEVGIDMNTGRIDHRTKPYEWEDALRYDKTTVLARYGDGYFQVRNGQEESILMFFNLKQREWTILKQLPYKMNNLALHNGTLYIPCSYGYWTYRIEAKQFHHQEQMQMKNGQRMLANVNAICFDRQGGFWIGTEKRGLLYAHPRKYPFKVMSWNDPEAIRYAMLMEGLEQNITEYNNQRANCMYTDSRGWTWYGTTTGIYLQKSANDEPIHITRRQGLLNEVICSVVEDKHHNIWVATVYGITCIVYDGQEKPFVCSFGPKDDVPAESFVNSKSICLDDGTIVMQAIDHVVAFHPDSFSVLKPHPSKLYPKLIRLLVNGNFVSPGVVEDGNIIIDRAITRVKDIYLNSNQNSVSLTFSALNFFRPLQTYYRVRVKGLDENWKVLSYFDSDRQVDSQGMLHLPLVGIQPGDYEVEVQASMYPDIWDVEPFVWVVHVHQPWWQTTGLLVILGLLLAAMLIVNFVYYNRNTKMRAKRANEEGDVIRKVSAFVERVSAYDRELLSPYTDALYTGVAQGTEELSPEFIRVMEKIIPFVKSNTTRELTMRQLSNASDTDIVHLYETVTANLYKSPRGLVLKMRLKQAVEMLMNTDDSVEQIARSCGFYSPNYFIGNFFHEFKVTPQEYRKERR